MIFADGALARHYLTHISYYRLRGYWIPFERPAQILGDHAFAHGTRFEDILGLYIFDRELRLLMLDAIERVEVSIRAAWAHHMAMQHGPHGYLDPAHHVDEERHRRNQAQLAEEVRRSRDIFLNHYRRKYTDPIEPPIWMAAEILSLGQISKWIGNLPTRDKKKIARPYELHHDIFTAFLHHLSVVRNICAHHGRLWNRRFRIRPMLPQRPPLSDAVNAAAPDRLHNTIVLLDHMMTVVAPDSGWRGRLDAHLGSCPHAPLAEMGFPPLA